MKDYPNCWPLLFSLLRLLQFLRPFLHLKMSRKSLTFDILYLSLGKECSCYCTKRHMSKAKVTKQGDFLRTVYYHTSTHTRRGNHIVFILTGGSNVSPHWWELTLTSWHDWLMNNGYERGGTMGGREMNKQVCRQGLQILGKVCGTLVLARLAYF